MTKKRTTSKIFVSIMLILATSFSIAFMAMQINKPINETNLSLSAVSDINLAEPYDIDNNIGQGGKGTIEFPYYEGPWNGRIKSWKRIFTNYSDSRSYLIETNVDPRDSIFGDDIIIEFNAYSQTPPLGTKKALKLSTFKANIWFYSTKNGKISKSETCYDKSSKGYTINSGNHDIYKVAVKITLEIDGVYYYEYYIFDNEYEGKNLDQNYFKEHPVTFS